MGKEQTNTTTLYRIVSLEEYNLVKSTGKFSEELQYMRAKWFFANDINFAKQWATTYYPEGNYKIIQVFAPNDMLKGVYFVEKIDRIGPGFCFELEEINKILQYISGH